MAKGQSNQGAMKRRAITSGNGKVGIQLIDTEGVGTVRQQGFARDLAAGLTLSDAYRRNYDVSGMKDQTIWSSASKLAKNPKVAAMVQGLLKEQERMMMQDAVEVRRHVMKRLKEESEDMEHGTSASRVRATELMGKVDFVGMFREITERRGAGERDPETIEKELHARLRGLMATIGRGLDSGTKGTE